MLLTFATLLIGATYFQDRLNDMSEKLIALAGSRFSEDTLSINTFSDRLQGFSQVLTDPNAYSLLVLAKTGGTILAILSTTTTCSATSSCITE